MAFICENCGEKKLRLMFEGQKPCYGDLCCDCCKKKGLQTEDCKLACYEMEDMMNGKELNENEKKGIFLERAISRTLKLLEIPHKPNPYGLAYSHLHGKNPDIIIKELDAVIECKNLKESQVYRSINKSWLDYNIINRPKTSKYSLKIALFSFKPSKTLVNHLQKHNWKAYGLGYQILNTKQEKKAIPRLKQQFWWLKKKYLQKSKSNTLQN